MCIRDRVNGEWWKNQKPHRLLLIPWRVKGSIHHSLFTGVYPFPYVCYQPCQLGCYGWYLHIYMLSAFICNESEIWRNFYLSIQFTEWTTGDVEKLGKLFIRITRGTFSDVARNWYRCPPHLGNNPIHFRFRKSLRQSVDFSCKSHTLFPDFKFLMCPVHVSPFTGSQ